MSHYLDGESVAAFAESPAFSWFAFFRSVVGTAQIWLKRRQERQELLDYLVGDHRAAADIGIDRSNAREWAKRPFWRA
jgi:uncharacterized protein YjiS (DUF1127 family)